MAHFLRTRQNDVTRDVVYGAYFVKKYGDNNIELLFIMILRQYFVYGAVVNAVFVNTQDWYICILTIGDFQSLYLNDVATRVLYIKFGCTLGRLWVQHRSS